MKRAWVTTLWHITSIVAARSRGQAIARTLASARGAGYRVEWKEVKAKRAKEYDGWAEMDESGVPWDEQYIHNVRD